MLLVEGEERKSFRLGRRRFQVPYSGYTPPAYFFIPLERGEKVAGRDFLWKFCVQLREGSGKLDIPSQHLLPRVTLSRGFALPQVLGLGENARWRWQGIPISLVLGLKLDWFSNYSKYEKNIFEGLKCISVKPHFHLKAMAPIFGQLALRPSLKLNPTPSINVKKNIWLGRSEGRLGFQFQINPLEWNSGKLITWKAKLMWHPSDSVQVRKTEVESDVHTWGLQYGRTFVPSEKTKVDLKATINLSPHNSSFKEGEKVVSFFSLNQLKFTKYFFTDGHKITPKKPLAYRRASHLIRKAKDIAVVPGHWIDPGGEPGAPGERDFALQVADAAEQQLIQHGWNVLRPDREAPHLKWVQYLNWVTEKTLRGTPVLEIHGQGSTADYRGFVLGVLGDKEFPLSKALSHNFGVFPMCWTDLAVPRRGGVLLECFNADEVVQMAPWHRTWAVSQLASTITKCVERARSSLDVS